MTLNFKQQFAAAVKSGRKRQTIRASGKRQYKAGQVLHLYTGLRRPGAKLLRKVKVKRTFHVGIGEHAIWLDHFTLSPLTAQGLAKADGFGSVEELREFFRRTYGLPFYGTLIQW